MDPSGGGDTAHTVQMGGTIGLGTPHNIKRTYIYVPSCKLELTRFSAWLRIQDGAECGNNVCLTSILLQNTSVRKDSSLKASSPQIEVSGDEKI